MQLLKLPADVFKRGGGDNGMPWELERIVWLDRDLDKPLTVTIVPKSTAIGRRKRNYRVGIWRDAR